MFKDLLQIFYYKKKSAGKKHRVFFIESEYIYEYLKPYIKSSKNKLTFLVCLNTSLIDERNNVIKLNFKKKIILELFFLINKSEYLYSSTPDLNNSIFKRTKFYNTKYIYIQHSNISLIMGYNYKAFNSFDVVNVVNQYQFQEVLALNNEHKLNIKPLRSKYLFKGRNKDLNFKYDLMIAFTWKNNFYNTNFFFKFLNQLKSNKIEFIVRPHPMSIVKKEIDIDKYIKNEINLDLDPIINFSKYDILLTDWSGIFVEHIFQKKNKPLLINSTPKILNKNYKIYNLTPLEIDLRKSLCFSYDFNQEEKLISDIVLFKKNKSLNNLSELDLNQFNDIFF